MFNKKKPKHQIRPFITDGLWLFLFFISLQLSAQQTPDFIIGSGSRGGNYYNTAQFIAKQYNKAFPENKVFAIETNGSNENIKLLKNNSIDFAIVQRNVLINNIYDEDEGIKNIEVVLPLFQEKLRIYTHHKKPQPITSLNKILKDTTHYVFGFTSVNGAAYSTFNKITKFLNIDISRMQTITGNYKDLINDFKTHKIDYLVTFSLPLQQLETLDNTSYLYLTQEQAITISNRMHNLGMTHLTEDNDYKTLGSWSFLVGSRKSLSFFKPPKKLITAIFQKTDSSFLYYQKIIKQSYNNLINHDKNEILQLRSLPVIFPLKKITGFRNINFTPYFMLLFFLAVLSLLHYHYKGRFFPKIKWRSIWNRYKHFQFGFIALIFVYFASIEMLVFAEKAFFHDVGIKSQILNLTRKDLHTWVGITTVTGNSNGIFPLSTLGKIMLALNSLNFWIGTLFIGVSEYIMYKINKKRKLGLMETKYNKHLVIFGWNSSTEKFILETISDSKKYMNKKLNIVCVVPDINAVLNSHKSLKELHSNKEIDIIQGDAIDKHILSLAKVEDAHSIILLSDEKSKLADERTVMRAHAISRYTKMKKNDGKVYKTTIVDRAINKIKDVFTQKTKLAEPSYKRYKIESNADAAYMIAELNSADYKESLVDAGANEIVVAGNYRHAIMKQSLFNHGISKVLDEIMQYNDYNEFYKIDLSKPQNKHLVGRTFDELLPALRKQNILLVAVHIVFHDENDNIIIDQNIIKELLEKEESKDIKRDVIINPSNEAEKNRPVDDDDHLIVLAVNMKAVDEGVPKVVFE